MYSESVFVVNVRQAVYSYHKLNLFLRNFNFRIFYVYETTSPFQFSLGVLGYPLLFLSYLDCFLGQVRFGLHLKHFGVYPRKIEGLIGVVCSPFIHGSLTHCTTTAFHCLCFHGIVLFLQTHCVEAYFVGYFAFRIVHLVYWQSCVPHWR